jgi:3-methyl-2-oxobutanoate hydroxymethyltransferase
MQDYVELTKPRITALILICTAVGYWFGYGPPFHFPTLVHLQLGTALMASGTAARNQWYEVDSDARMRRKLARCCSPPSFICRYCLPRWSPTTVTFESWENLMSQVRKHLRVPDLAVMKQRRERIVMLTAYDSTMARIFDRAGIDPLLVGDSLGQVILGFDTTVPVTLDAIIHHTMAVTRGANCALVVADMPFLTYQVTPEQAMRNAARLFQEGGAAAVKLEGGRAIAETVRKLTLAGLPVMAHVGLTPQHVHRLGGMRQQARDEKGAQELILDALALEEAGAFAVVLEAIPDGVAEAVTSQLRIPTIGIGAGPHCDGQVLVSYDVLGLFDGSVPPFVKRYAQLGNAIQSAAKDYADDVRSGVYPESAVERRESAPALAIK